MARFPGALLAALGCVTSLCAQVPTDFEAASVKRVEPDPRLLRMQGGPGSTDPGRIDYGNMTLLNLLGLAYGLKQNLIIGPGWLGEERYDIHATLPPGVTRDQFRIMLQRLLTERFRIQSHPENRKSTIFALVVAKGGPKLNPPVTDAKAGPPYYTIGPVLHISPQREDMAWLANLLSGNLGRTVIDDTHLAGRYSFTLDFSLAGLTGADPGEAEAALMRALQEQCGLKLETRPGTIDVLVIDSAEKTPVEN